MTYELTPDKKRVILEFLDELDWHIFKRITVAKLYEGLKDHENFGTFKDLEENLKEAMK